MWVNKSHFFKITIQHNITQCINHKYYKCEIIIRKYKYPYIILIKKCLKIKYIQKFSEIIFLIFINYFRLILSFECKKFKVKVQNYILNEYTIT